MVCLRNISVDPGGSGVTEKDDDDDDDNNNNNNNNNNNIQEDCNLKILHEKTRIISCQFYQGKKLDLNSVKLHYILHGGISQICF
jgi:hypothetical protein